MIPGFLQALTEYYKNDKIAPGLQMAYLNDKNLWYVAVHTFPGDTIASRKVVAKATDSNFNSAVIKCQEVWESIILEEQKARVGVN